MLPGLPSGELAKMTITAFRDANISPAKLMGLFVVMFNPNQYTRRYANRVTNREAAGDSATQSVNMGAEPEEMTFEFLFDGTGVAPAAVSINTSLTPQSLVKQAINLSGALGAVEGMVRQFLSMTYVPNNESHEPPYLILSWGVLQFTCKLKSADVNYTLFDPAGRPLRAKVNATFTKHDPPALIQQLLNFRSPDLTRYRIVEEGDTLHQLSERIYEDPRYYLQLAKVNKINHFRRIATGTSLRMPPLKNTQDTASDT
ncbi:MAG: hypothetical protein SF053_21860 [Bacteroidia bacterium]|nr:hypothetical protein [Bacteroidia bacterium]